MKNTNIEGTSINETVTPLPHKGEQAVQENIGPAVGSCSGLIGTGVV